MLTFCRRRLFNSVVLLLFAAVIAAVTLTAVSTTPATAQVEQDCGIIDGIDYPVDGISMEHDDFGMYRANFQGHHAGVDMAFDRPETPIRAAARGRVTFSDPAGWDTEKGVVIIEHRFPDGSTYFTLYGHMEEVGSNIFPKVGACLLKGDIVGTVGRPSQSAPHLHYEIRRQRATTGGPGYWDVDPLDGGWMHPLDFTEAWRLRLSPAYRGMLNATTAPVSPPIPMLDGSAAFIQRNYIEQRSVMNQTVWRLDVRGLVGAVGLPNGQLLGRTRDNRVVVVEDGRFSAVWNTDRALLSPPYLLGDTVAFAAENNTLVGYSSSGELRWEQLLDSAPSRFVQQGEWLAITGETDSGYKLWVIGADGAFIYQGSAPAPIVPLPKPGGGFFLLVGSQVGALNPDSSLAFVMDAGQALGQNSQIAVDVGGNMLLYPGAGRQIFLYAPGGGVRWQVVLPALPVEPPLLGLGTGCLAYALTADGALLAYSGTDGTLLGQTGLYAGGTHGYRTARFVTVGANEQVQFSAGYLSVATVDGLQMAGLDQCSPL